MTTVTLIALPIQIQGQPLPEDECAFPNSPFSQPQTRILPVKKSLLLT